MVCSAARNISICTPESVIILLSSPKAPVIKSAKPPRPFISRSVFSSMPTISSPISVVEASVPLDIWCMAQLLPSVPEAAPVEVTTGMKNIARATPRPTNCWLSTLAIIKLKISIAGIYISSPVATFFSAVI